MQYVLPDNVVNTLRQYQVANSYYYRDYVKVLRSLPEHSKGIIYFDHITPLKIVERYLINRGYRTGSFWSLRNETHAMTQEQINIRQHIIDNQMIPSDIDILLINASCQTGVNIKNTDIDFMLIHSTNDSVVTQARGRLRHDLPTLWRYDKNLIESKHDLMVPPNYLNRKLVKSERDELCAIIRYMRLNGSSDYYKWGKLKTKLESFGYSFTETTVGHGGKINAWIIEPPPPTNTNCFGNQTDGVLFHTMDIDDIIKKAPEYDEELFNDENDIIIDL
jgi:hypothetical protein